MLIGMVGQEIMALRSAGDLMMSWLKFFDTSRAEMMAVGGSWRRIASNSSIVLRAAVFAGSASSDVKVCMAIAFVAETLTDGKALLGTRRPSSLVVCETIVAPWSSRAARSARSSKMDPLLMNSKGLSVPLPDSFGHKYWPRTFCQ